MCWRNDGFADATAFISNVGGAVAPANGSVSVVDGQVHYTPAPDFHGTDRFSYTVTTANSSTESNTESALVEVTVNSVLDAEVQLRPRRNSPPSGKAAAVSLNSKGKIFAGIYSTSADPFDANWIEHRSTEPKVRGSNPLGTPILQNPQICTSFARLNAADERMKNGSRADCSTAVSKVLLSRMVNLADLASAITR